MGDVETLLAIPDDALAALEQSDPAGLADCFAALGERPAVRIDLTDPPTPPAAEWKGMRATGADPDAALLQLAAVVVAAARKAKAEVAAAQAIHDAIAQVGR